MLDWLKKLDTDLLLLINRCHNDFFDTIMFGASDKLIWIPFYLFLAIVLARKAPVKIWLILIFAGILITMSDQFSVFVKDHILRYRPCHNLSLQDQLHLVNNQCGGQYGFVSSHAANVMALSLFVLLLTRNKIKWLSGLMMAWCLMVSYSRIYLGQHYPADVIGGWLCGATCAWICYDLLQRASRFIKASK